MNNTNSEQNPYSESENAPDKISFTLKDVTEINKLTNCPVSNEEKTIKLYRWSANIPMQPSDFLPMALEDTTRFIPDDKKCLSWGVSTHNTITGSQNAFKIFSKKKQAKLKSIYSIEVDKTLAIKHQSGSDKSHYTVYMYESTNFIDKFSQENI